MSIGTSIGAHFEDAFDHQAGVPYVRDDNVVTPDQADQNKQLEQQDYDVMGGIQVGLKKVFITGEPPSTDDSNQTKADVTPDNSPFKGPVGGSLEPAGALKSTEGTDPTSRSVISKLTGSDGGERYQTWPERMVRGMMTTAHDVGSGKIPMWAMDDNGDFHTSVEGLEAAHALMPAAGSGVHPTIHLRGDGLKALESTSEEGPDVFRQFMATRGRSQQSNITENHPEPGTPEFDRMYGYDQPLSDNGHVGPNHHLNTHPDQMTDHDFYRWGEYQPENGMTPAQEDRWVALDAAEGIRMRNVRSQSSLNEWSPTRTTEHTHDYTYDQDSGPREYTAGEWGGDENGVPRHWSPDVRDKVTAALKDKDVKLFKDESRSEGREHEFKFANKDGLGKINLTERRGGKDLYVDIMGKVDSNGFVNWNSSQSFGHSETKSLLKQLMNEFPKAETISGLRVSGARVESGAGQANAMMRLPGRGKPKE